MNGSIFNNSQYFKKLGLKSLDKGKQLEQSRIEQGWIWLTKGKTSKLADPKKIPQLIEEGWRKP